MLINKPIHDIEKELHELNHRVERLEKEINRIELLERMQAQHEIMLAKKISDINRFDDELKKIVKKEDLESISEELKRLDAHDAMLTENAMLLRQVVNELGYVKDSHGLVKKELFEKEHLNKGELDERLETVKQALLELEHLKLAHKKKVGKEELTSIREELHDRMAQLEYQNKLIMKYLKMIDEALQNNHHKS